MGETYTELQWRQDDNGWHQVETSIEIADGDYNPTRRSILVEWKDGVRHVNGKPAHTLPWTVEYKELHKND